MDTQSNEASPVAPPGNTELNEVSRTHELDPLSLCLSPLCSPWAANESLYLSDARLPPLPSLPHDGELSPATSPHRRHEAQHIASVAGSDSLQDLPAPSACPPGPGGVLRTIVNMGSARGSTGAPGVLMSRTTTNQRNAAFANMLLKGAQRALNLQHAQYAHALQYCHTVQQWYAEVAHGEQAPQNAYSQQNAQNLDAAPTEPAVVTTGEPENTANANDAHLPLFAAPHVRSTSAAPLAPDLDQVIDVALLAEPDADGVVSGTESLPNWA